ncbi:MAG: methyltransferase domain-containing protein [Acidimicrobiia bacterium]
MTKDLMFRDEIEKLVADAYAETDSPEGAPARAHYRGDELAQLPEGAWEWSFGVGNPLPWAHLQPGETVLDLGSGAGMDVLLAARRVGETGKAVGVDMIPDMVERATRNAAAAGVTNVEFLLAKMDDLPLPDDSLDVIISNGAINLTARKSRVFAEARRVLKPGGRLAVTDLIIDETELPPEILTHPSAWAG